MLRSHRGGVCSFPHRGLDLPLSRCAAVQRLVATRSRRDEHRILGVLAARMLEGMKFAVGPTIAARREVLQRIGGFDVSEGLFG